MAVPPAEIQAPFAIEFIADRFLFLCGRMAQVAARAQPPSA
jgi:hypothetical protein